MSHPLAFKPHADAEEYAKTLSGSIEGKNSRSCQIISLVLTVNTNSDLTPTSTVLLVGATVNSLGGEFLRVVAPYAKTIWVAGRSSERQVQGS